MNLLVARGSEGVQAGVHRPALFAFSPTGWHIPPATEKATTRPSPGDLENAHDLKICMQSGRNMAQTVKVPGNGLNILRRSLESCGQ